MKYDDASWHSEGDFPTDLTAEAAFTHTGQYLAWALLVGFGSVEFLENFEDDLEELRGRTISPSQIFKNMDGKLLDEDLTTEGNGFTNAYFDFENGQYLKDYKEVLSDGLPTMYHVADTWENFDKLKLVLDRRLKAWRAEQC
jgi:hypothetical protein